MLRLLCLAVVLVSTCLQGAAVPLAERVRLTTEHVDLRIVFAPEGTNLLSLVAFDHDHSTNHSATNFALVVAESAKLSVPEGLPDLGPAGSDLWVLPASQNPALLYLGLNAGGLPLPPQSLDLFLRRVDGPGHFVAWQFAGPGELSVSHNTRNGLSEADRFTPAVGGHEHHNLGFSTNGLFTLWFQVRASVGGTNAWSPEVPVLFAVEPVPAVIAGPAVLATSGLEPDGSLRLLLSGTPDATYTVEGSTDLRAWEPIRQVTAGPTPQAVPLSLPAQIPPRFFRAVTP
jgi:hypothetical protein